MLLFQIIQKVRLGPWPEETGRPSASQRGTADVCRFDVKLRPGTPFVSPPFFVFGERYDDPDVPDDDPVELADLLAFIFETTEIQVVLNGQVVLEGTGAELEEFLVPPTYFNEPTFYAEPQPRGEDLNAVAAVWVMGIGAIYHPLPVGRHTLEQHVTSLFFGEFHFTYHIHVSPK